MVPKTFPRQKAGEPIAASTINAPLDAIESALKTTFVAPLAATTAGGVTTVISEAQGSLWAKLSSGSGTGPYVWTEQIPQSGGTWTNGWLTDASGADPAYNTVNSTPTLPVILEIRRNALGIWTFSAGSC